MSTFNSFHRLHVQSLSDTVVVAVSRGDGGMHILPDTPENTAAFVTGSGYLSEHDARALGEFLIRSADEQRAKPDRKEDFAHDAEMHRLDMQAMGCQA